MGVWLLVCQERFCSPFVTHPDGIQNVCIEHVLHSVFILPDVLFIWPHFLQNVYCSVHKLTVAFPLLKLVHTSIGLWFGWYGHLHRIWFLGDWSEHRGQSPVRWTLSPTKQHDICVTVCHSGHSVWTCAQYCNMASHHPFVQPSCSLTLYSFSGPPLWLSQQWQAQWRRICLTVGLACLFPTRLSISVAGYHLPMNMPNLSWTSVPCHSWNSLDV